MTRSTLRGTSEVLTGAENDGQGTGGGKELAWVNETSFSPGLAGDFVRHPHSDLPGPSVFFKSVGNVVGEVTAMSANVDGVANLFFELCTQPRKSEILG